MLSYRFSVDFVVKNPKISNIFCDFLDGFFRKKFEKFSHPPKILSGRSDFDRLYLKGKLPFLLEVKDEILACT